MIPKHIEHLKFLKVKKGIKEVHIKDWPKKSEHHLSASEISPWVQEGNNYGVICGPISGIGIIDCDHKEYVMAVENNLPETFSVQSSSTSKIHFYFKFKNFPSRSKIAVKDPDKPTDAKAQGGDIRNGNFYVIGPGSIHPDTKKPYTVIDNVPIAEIDYNDVFKVGERYRFKSVRGFQEIEILKRDNETITYKLTPHYSIIRDSYSTAPLYLYMIIKYKYSKNVSSVFVQIISIYNPDVPSQFSVLCKPKLKGSTSTIPKN